MAYIELRNIEVYIYAQGEVLVADVLSQFCLVGSMTLPTNSGTSFTLSLMMKRKGLSTWSSAVLMNAERGTNSMPVAAAASVPSVLTSMVALWRMLPTLSGLSLICPNSPLLNIPLTSNFFKISATSELPLILNIGIVRVTSGRPHFFSNSLANSFLNSLLIASMKVLPRSVPSAVLERWYSSFGRLVWSSEGTSNTMSKRFPPSCSYGMETALKLSSLPAEGMVMFLRTKCCEHRCIHFGLDISPLESLKSGTGSNSSSRRLNDPPTHASWKYTTFVRRNLISGESCSNSLLILPLVRWLTHLLTVSASF